MNDLIPPPPRFQGSTELPNAFLFFSLHLLHELLQCFQKNIFIELIDFLKGRIQTKIFYSLAMVLDAFTMFFLNFNCSLKIVSSLIHKEIEPQID